MSKKQAAIDKAKEVWDKVYEEAQEICDKARDKAFEADEVYRATLAKIESDYE